MNYTFNQRYEQQVEASGTRLCIGLDTDIATLPPVLATAQDPVLAFNRLLISATSDLCCAYKPNIAFYESLGPRGLDTLRETQAFIPENVITIIDAKRGDIGNTAERYAHAMLDEFGFDAVTVNPYMGTDTLETYFERTGKGVFVLALTSNPGSQEFQRLQHDGAPLYRRVIDRCLERFGERDQLGFVIGATHPGELQEIREHVGNNIPLLIPGIGAQGGDAEGTVRANDGGIAFINVSRGISKAWQNAGSDPDEGAITEALRHAALRYIEQLSIGDPDERVAQGSTVDS